MSAALKLHGTLLAAGLAVLAALVWVLLALPADAGGAALAAQVAAGTLVVALLAAALVLHGSLVAPVAALAAVADSAAVPPGADVPGTGRADDLGRLARRLAALQDLEREGEVLATALDSTAGMVMVADRDHVIRYMNAPLRRLLTAFEPEIRRSLPHFSAAKLIGANVDVFHRNPAHQRGMLATMQDSHQATIALGAKRLGLAVSPVRDARGERVGTVVEWRDQTEELRLRDDVETLIAAVGRGELDRRIDTGTAAAEVAAVATAMNAMVEAVSSGIGEAAETIGRVARGDVSARMTGSYEGLFDRLKSDVNGLADRLAELSGEIRSSADAVSSSLNDIVGGAGDLSARAEQQASALEETAATMEEMSATIRSNATNAAAANALANQTKDAAEQAGEVVRATVAAIERIESSSSRIVEIISVIDSIAFQTNLLALNAAVEAARAGEAGRGFAVVASEVRQLAQRSSDSASDIKALISESASHVADGVQLVRETGTALESILGSVSELGSKVSDIATATAEQSTGVDEITSAVSHLDDMTQKNAALAATSVDLAQTAMDRADGLRELIGFFRNEGEDPRRARPSDRRRVA